MRGVAPNTGADEGCISFDILLEQNQTARVFFVKRWQSMACYKKYTEWRIATGMMETMAPFLAGAPDVKYCKSLAM
ncbi:putative quinol monooxygenase [Oceanicoccus sp. KOV_DT_Chl]|uniref:putative quinol monooxygenase n=1 Tax=Oceanicoccus sp. KOV_DT_Chl TaxID=1904639 RepID=UPI000C79670D|nr:antibiotic biosynthesis monooxygenase [Oceanicoccus sp. KOV_DT_Chl]